MERAARWATEWMTLDLRSLAAFRIVLALTILIDLADRCRRFVLFTEDGPLPLARLVDAGPLLTLHQGPPAFVAGVFIVQALVAVALALGFRTRTMCVLSLIFAFSLTQRSLLTTFKGDDLLRVLLFWACMLPVGARYSLDSGNARGPGAVRSFAAAGLVLVTLLMFFSSAIDKLGSPLWRSGEALGRYVDTWMYPTTIGRALWEAAPGVFPWFTFMALAFELGAPLLLLAPRWQLRALGALCLFGLMFGIGLMLDAGLFPLVTATGLVALVPSEAWREVPVVAPAPFGAHEKAAALCAFAMVLTSVLNLVARPLPAPVTAVLQAAGLDQSWPMFHRPEHAPRGWLFVVGHRRQGPPFDVLRGLAADATAAPPPMSTMLTFRERRVLQRTFLGEGGGWTNDVAAWLCRTAVEPVDDISVGFAEQRGAPGTVLVIEIVKDHPCAVPGNGR